MTHLATNSYTACGTTTNQPVSEMAGNGEFEGYNQTTVQHSSDPDFVTCEACKRTEEFAKALQEAKEIVYEE